MHRIDTGCYRDGETQVVSGLMGKEKVHYQAPYPKLVKQEMDKFLDWFLNCLYRGTSVEKSAEKI